MNGYYSTVTPTLSAPRVPRVPRVSRSVEPAPQGVPAPRPVQTLPVTPTVVTPPAEVKVSTPRNAFRRNPSSLPPPPIVSEGAGPTNGGVWNVVRGNPNDLPPPPIVSEGAGPTNGGVWKAPELDLSSLPPPPIVSEGAGPTNGRGRNVARGNPGNVSPLPSTVKSVSQVPPPLGVTTKSVPPAKAGKDKPVKKGLPVIYGKGKLSIDVPNGGNRLQCRATLLFEVVALDPMNKLRRGLSTSMLSYKCYEYIQPHQDMCAHCNQLAIALQTGRTDLQFIMSEKKVQCSRIEIVSAEPGWFTCSYVCSRKDPDCKLPAGEHGQCTQHQSLSRADSISLVSISPGDRTVMNSKGSLQTPVVSKVPVSQPVSKPQKAKKQVEVSQDGANNTGGSRLETAQPNPLVPKVPVNSSNGMQGSRVRNARAAFEASSPNNVTPSTGGNVDKTRRFVKGSGVSNEGQVTSTAQALSDLFDKLPPAPKLEDKGKAPLLEDDDEWSLNSDNEHYERDFLNDLIPDYIPAQSVYDLEVKPVSTSPPPIGGRGRALMSEAFEQIKNRRQYLRDPTRDSGAFDATG